MAKTIIYPHRRILQENAEGADQNPIVVMRGEQNCLARYVEILGPSQVIYRPSGTKQDTRVWIETESGVVAHISEDEVEVF